MEPLSQLKKKLSLTKSLFDEVSIKEQEKYQLWEKKNLLLNARKNDAIIEGTLFKKSKTKGYWKQKVYKLYPGKLVAYEEDKDGKQQISGIMFLDNVRLERIKSQEKETKYGLRFINNNKFCELYLRTRDFMQQWFEALKKFCILTSFNHDYSIIKVLGKGNFAKVYYARSKQTGDEFAVKAFDKDKFKEQDRPALIKEIAILRQLQHSHVIRMYEVYENENYIFLVKELLKGGELFHKLKKHGGYSEEYAAKLMKKLLSALSYIHLKGVLHRDLKPENLILRSKADEFDICIADFGLADFYDPKGNYMFKRCGTPGYVAPEVLADKIYDFKVDVFSAGVIMFILLSGSAPFKGNKYEDIVLKNFNCSIDFTTKNIHQKLSPEAFDLLKKLLKKDPQERISATEALNHSWFQQYKEEKPQQQQSPEKIKMEEDITKQIEKDQNCDLVTKTPLMGRGEFQTPQNYQSPDSWKRSYKQQNQNGNSNGYEYRNQMIRNTEQSDPNLFSNELTPSSGIKQTYQQTPQSLKINAEKFGQNAIQKENQDQKVHSLKDFDDIDDIEDTPLDENMKSLQQYDFSAKLRMGSRHSQSSSFNSPMLHNIGQNNLVKIQEEKIVLQQQQNNSSSSSNNNTQQTQKQQIKQAVKKIRELDVV